MNKCEIWIRPVPVLKEEPGQECFKCLELTYHIEQDMVPQGSIGRLPIRYQLVPRCTYEAFSISDAAGELPLEASEETFEFRTYRYFYPKRTPEGTLTVTYRAFFPEIREGERTGGYPYLLQESHGASACGKAFMFEIPGFTGTIALKWVLPEGMHGVSSLAEGDFSFEGPMEKLTKSFLAFGALKKYESGTFSLYWITEPPQELMVLEPYLEQLYVKMSKFFKDQDPNYRIFLRRDLKMNGGGWQLSHCCCFTLHQETAAELIFLKLAFAHEMVHGWLAMPDHPLGSAAWYNEGCAEYYGLLLPLRFGLMSKKDTEYIIRRRWQAYRSNPLLRITNEEAGQASGLDRKAAMLNENRGFFFMANCDAEIRENTMDQYSLDTIVLQMLQRSREGRSVNTDVFLDMVRAVSGLSLYDRFQRMERGEELEMHPRVFHELR